VANLQIKNLPEDLHEELRRRAALEDMTIRDYVLRLIRRELDVQSKLEWFGALQQREPVTLGVPVVDVIDEVRAERDG
jgi:hypothetical protein